MISNRNLNYIICLVIFGLLFALFSLMLPRLEVSPGIGSEGYYQTPGGVTVEDIFVLIMLVVGTVITGVVAIFLTKFFLKRYIKYLGQKKKIGLVKVEDPVGVKHLLTIFFRALFLGFFTSNICYTLASQQAVVNWMHNPYPAELATTIIPDLITMLHLLWVLAIPSTLIFVPIWFVMDVGLVNTSKVSGIEFETANLPLMNIYRMLRGYAGLGFIYNLFVTLLATIAMAASTEALFLLLLSPVLIISFMFPVVILVDSQKNRFRESLMQILKELRWRRKFVAEYKLEKIAEYGDVAED